MPSLHLWNSSFSLEEVFPLDKQNRSSDWFFFIFRQVFAFT